MRRLTLFQFLFGLFVLSATCSYALEIPLGGESGGSGGGGGKIAYVDMERIFQVYPQTREAKEDYAKQLAKKRQQLADKEAELANLKSRVSVLESTLKDVNANGATAAPQASTPTASGESPQSLLDMKKDLEQKQAELEDLRKRAADDLAAFERQQTQLIFGKIYQALRDVCSEEQVTLVVDKASILYGSADIDLTEKLQTRVRGY